MLTPSGNPIDPVSSAEAVTSILSGLDTTKASPKEREAIIAVQRQYRQEYLSGWKELLTRQRIQTLFDEVKRRLTRLKAERPQD
jgi:hypothetical protein